MKFGLKSFWLVVAVILLSSSPQARGQSVPTVKLALDRAYYATTDTFSALGVVGNNSDSQIRYARVAISVFPALKTGESINRPLLTSPAPILRQAWSRNLGPGTTEFPWQKDLKVAGLAEGVYPVELGLTLPNRETFVDRSFLVVVNPKEKPLPVALVYQVHRADRREPGGLFIDNNLAELIKSTPEEKGRLLQELEVFDNHQSLAVNIVFSPTLNRQLHDMRDGYSFRRENKSISVSADSSEAQSAADFLQKESALAGKESFTTLAAPYGHASLTTLSALDWERDGRRQVKLGRTRPGNNQWRDHRPDGLLSPEGLIDRRIADWLLDADYKYAVGSAVPDGKQDAATAPAGPFRYDRKRERLTVFPVDLEISEWLKTVSIEKAGSELTAILAQRVLADATAGVTMVFTTPAESPQPELLERVAQTLVANPWVNPVKLSDRLVEDAPLINPAAASDLSRVNKDALRRLEQARRDLEYFAMAVSSRNQLRQKIEQLFLSAQSAETFFAADQAAGRPATAYAEYISQTIEKEFSKLKLSGPPKIAFSTRTGKIPVAIFNQTGYPLKVRIALSGKDFHFPDDIKKEVTVTPKENLVSYDINARFVGLSKLTVRAMVGDREIARSQIDVSVSNMLRLIVVLATTVGTGGIVMFALIKRRKTRAR